MGVGLGTRRPRRAAAAIGASLAVLTVGVGWPSGAAEAAPTQATDACPEAFPVADLTIGLVGEGLTVDSGTTPEPFTATVQGVIDDGIAAGLDMIIVQTDSPAIRQARGVWAGMSGSPVYAPDGRLIGAIAYGLAGESTIAGVTPAADMYTLLDRPGPAVAAATEAAEVDLPADVERRVVASGAATAAEAAAGLRRLPVPLGVSGVGQARIDQVAERLDDRFPGARVYAAGAAGVGGTASPDEIFPGSNYAATVAYGDATIGGVGTTTAVCTVGSTTYALAFGHPFTFLGATTASTHVADAVVVQDDNLFGPFKVANIGGVVGTTDQDRLAGIRSPLGAGPATIPIRSTITSSDDGTSRTGATQLTMQQFAPDAAFTHLLANVDRVADRVGGGSLQIRSVVRGTRASGAPFTLDLSQAWADQSDVSFFSLFEVADTLFALDTNPFEDVKITSVDYTGSVSGTFSQYTVDSVLLRRPNGTFVPAPTDEPLRVAAGTRINVRVVLTPHRNVGPNRTVDLSVVVPPGTAGQSGRVDVTGGAAGGPDFPEPTNFDGFLTQLQGAFPNNAVTAEVFLDGRPRGTPGTRARQLADAVVVGDASFDIDVVTPPGARPAVVDGTTWKLRSSLSTGLPTSTFTYGAANDVQLMGDWDGNGSLTPAVFRDGAWRIRAVPSGFAGANFSFGQAGDIPVVGDWDGDGDDTIGVYRGGRWLLRNSLRGGPADVDFTYGSANQRPVVGDWDGDGDDTAGVFRNGSWSLRFTNSPGAADRAFPFGTTGDVPVVGEWDGDGRDEVGVYRNGQWFLRNDLSSGASNRRFTYGHPASHPLVWG